MQSKKHTNNEMEFDPQTKSILWTLIVSLNLVRYCCREIAPKTHKNTLSAKYYKELYKLSGKYLNRGTRQATEQEKKDLEDLTHENVAIMAETMGILTHIPPENIDWLCDKINHIAKSIIIKKDE